jgi:hypothetical protein
MQYIIVIIWQMDLQYVIRNIEIIIYGQNIIYNYRVGVLTFS